MTAEWMQDIDQLQRHCEQIPEHLRRAFLQGEADAGRLSLESSLSTSDLVWLCVFGKADSFGVLHGEMILQHRGAEEVAKVVAGPEGINVFMRVFGMKAIDDLPENLRKDAKRSRIEQDFSL